jgi:hypothetical protein
VGIRREIERRNKVEKIAFAKVDTIGDRVRDRKKKSEKKRSRKDNSGKWSRSSSVSFEKLKKKEV